jgi:mannosyl-oligosaccharide glucosidase
MDWLDVSNPKTGWIPREQNRGAENRGLGGSGFELSKDANPPTLILGLRYLLEKNKDFLTTHFTNTSWTQLKKWYEWWNNTEGVFKKNQHTFMYKWWGPLPISNLGSGMDDFPRSDGMSYTLYSLDATMWFYFFTDNMIELAKVYENDNTFVNELSTRKEKIRDNVYKFMYDENDNVFRERLTSIFGSQKLNMHMGYPNLFPLIFGIVENNSKDLEAYLKILSDDYLMGSPWGIRSISKSDPAYLNGGDYWRGPIWISINYMTLRGLKLYYSNNEKAREVYNMIRMNLITNICTQKKKRGYFYEHYNQKNDGLGQGNHPFNGWTSLISLIISEEY